MISKETPCHNCPNRTVTCHSNCEAYKAFFDENEKRKDIIGQARYKEKIMTDYYVSEVLKNHRSRGLDKCKR